MRSRSSRCSPKPTESDLKAIQRGIHRVAEATHLEFVSGRLEHAAEEASVDGGHDDIGEMLQHARRESSIMCTSPFGMRISCIPVDRTRWPFQTFQELLIIGENEYLNL